MPAKGDGHDADEDGAAHASSHENGDEDQTRGREQDLGIGGGFAEANKGGGIGDYDFCVAQTNERDEEAYTRGGAMLEAVRDAVDDLLAELGQREQEEEQFAGEEDDAQSSLPRGASTDDDGIGEVGVEGHARGERDRTVGPKPHDKRGNRGGNTGGEEDASDGYARFFR